MSKTTWLLMSYKANLETCRPELDSGSHNLRKVTMCLK